MILNIKLSDGMKIENWQIDSYTIIDNWLRVTDLIGIDTYINLNNVDIYTIYQEKEINNEKQND